MKKVLLIICLVLVMSSVGYSGISIIGNTTVIGGEHLAVDEVNQVVFIHLDNSIISYDVSGTNPVMLGNYTNVTNSLTININDIVYGDGSLYMSCGGAFGNKYIVKLNVSTPVSMSLSAFSSDFAYHSGCSSAYNIEYADGYIAIAGVTDIDGTICIFDVDNLHTTTDELGYLSQLSDYYDTINKWNDIFYLNEMIYVYLDGGGFPHGDYGVIWSFDLVNGITTDSPTWLIVSNSSTPLNGEIGVYNNNVFATVESLDIVATFNHTSPYVDKTWHDGNISGDGSPNYLNGAYGISGTNKFYVGSNIDNSLGVFDILDITSPVLMDTINGTGSPNFLNGVNEVHYDTINNLIYVLGSDSLGIFQDDSFNISILSFTSDDTNYLLGETGKFNLTYDNTSLGLTITGWVEYNGTNYTSILNGNVLTTNVPFKNLGTFNAYGYISAIDGSTTIITNSTTSITIDNFNITNCTTGTPFMNINLYEEHNNSYLNGIINAEFTAWVNGLDGSVNQTFSISQELNGNLTLCMNPSWGELTLDALIEYVADDHDRRYYWLDSHEIDNTTEELDLYLLETSQSNPISILVTDSSGIAQEDVTILLQRIYPGSNGETFITIAMGKTGGEGKYSIDVDLYDVLYKFILLQDGVQVAEFKESTIDDTTIELETSVTLRGSFWKYRDVIYGCSNTTTIITCILTDTGDGLESATLDLYLVGGTNWNNFCDNTSTGSSITLTCNYSAYPTGFIRYDLVATIDGINYALITDYLDNTIPLIDADEGGLFPIFILVLLFAGIGSRDPSTAILLSILAIVIGYVLGLLPIGFAGLIGLVVAGAIFMWKSGG